MVDRLLNSGMGWGQTERLLSSIQDQPDLVSNASLGRGIKAFFSQFLKPSVQNLFILGINR